jgi:hypothetical protein
MSLREVPFLGGQEERLANVPSLQNFVDACERVLDGSSPELFWQCEPMFRELVSGPFPQQLVNYELATLKSGGAAPMSSSSFQLSVYRSANLTLGVVRIGREPPLANLQESPTHCMLGTLSSTPVLIDLYERTFAKPETGKPSLVRKKSIALGKGEIVRVAAGAEVADVRSESESILAGFMSRAVFDQVYEYDRSSLEPVREITDNQINARMVYAIRALAEVGDSSSLPILEDLYENPAPFVRWTVIKAAMKMDRSAGVRLLQRAAASDSDLKLRNAAIKAIEKIHAAQRPAGIEG